MTRRVGLSGLAAMSALVAGAAAVVSRPLTSALADVERGRPPDRLSIDEASPHYQPTSFTKQVDVYLDDRKRPYDTEEYCVSEGWILTTSGRVLRGTVRPEWRPAPPAAPEPAPPADLRAAAEAKRARRAARNLRSAGGET